MASLFDKFKQGLSKTRQGFVDEIVKLVHNKYAIDDELLDQLEEILIRADIGVETSLQIIENLKEQVLKEGFRESGDLIAYLKEQLTEHLTRAELENNGSTEDLFFQPQAKPFVIMVVGVNGTGKTTTIAKLAKAYRDRGKKGQASSGRTGSNAARGRSGGGGIRCDESGSSPRRRCRDRRYCRQIAHESKPDGRIKKAPSGVA